MPVCNLGRYETCSGCGVCGWAARLQQLGAGVVEQAGVRPEAVAGVRGAEVLQAAQDVGRRRVQQRRPRVVLQGGERPQAVAQLLQAADPNVVKSVVQSTPMVHGCYNDSKEPTRVARKPPVVLA